jgi:hypothetical protein
MRCRICPYLIKGAPSARQAGLRAAQAPSSPGHPPKHSRGLLVRTESLADWDVLSQNPTAMLRRRTDYAAWTEWETVQDGMSLDWRISGQA